MKKLICIALALCLAFSFTACFDELKEDIRGNQTQVTSTPEATPEQKPELTLGTANALNYENKFIGLGLNLKSGWTFSTDEQIKELNNIAADLAGEEFKQAMENATIIYDMQAKSDNQVDNVIVNLEKVDALTLSILDLEQNLKSAFDLIKNSLENMGYNNISYQMGTITIDGKSFPSMTISMQVQGINVYQKMFSIKCDGYLASINITSVSLDTINDILSGFYLTK